MPSQRDQEDDDKNASFTMKKDSSAVVSISGDATTATNQLLTFANVPLGMQGSVDVVEFSVLLQEAWTYVSTFTNAWVNLSTGYGKTGYYKRYDGTVELKIAIKTGTIGLPAFNLPISCRPGAIVYGLAYSNSVASVVKIDVNGDVTPLTGTNAAFSANVSFLALDSRPPTNPAFPIDVATKIDKPVGVIAIASWPENENTRVNGLTSIGLDWTVALRNRRVVIRVNNMSGLAYNKRHSVRLMIFGG